jgi:hypothetical protein
MNLNFNYFIFNDHCIIQLLVKGKKKLTKQVKFINYKNSAYLYSIFVLFNIFIFIYKKKHKEIQNTKHLQLYE